MKHLILTTFVLASLHLGAENITDQRLAEKGFQKRWHAFHGDTRTFPIWTKDWKKEDLKSRYDQMLKERWEAYFINPEDFPENNHKPNAVGIYKTEYEALKTFSSCKSRYPLPGTFDYNRASPQYDASIITLNGQHFLAMQAPMAENLSLFSQLLAQYHVSDLVRLTPASDHGKENSFPYWEGHINTNPKNGRCTLQIADQEIDYFFTDSWLNHEGIDPKRLIALVKSVMNNKKENQMIAVHCRAGVGRTGTFLAAYDLIQSIDSQIASGVKPDQIQVSIDQVFWELSLQRPFMISHYVQYELLYQLVDDYIEHVSKIEFSAEPKPLNSTIVN